MAFKECANPVCQKTLLASHHGIEEPHIEGRNPERDWAGEHPIVWYCDETCHKAHQVIARLEAKVTELEKRLDGIVNRNDLKEGSDY
jgi:hypothetical protein